MQLTRLRSVLALACTVACAAPDTRNREEEITRALPHTTPLDWTHGEWVGTRRSAADGETHPLHVRVTPMLGGASQLREMWVEHDGGVYRGISIQLRETETGRWTRYYANDVRGRLVTLRAVDDAGDLWRSGPNDSGRWSENRTDRPDDDTWISTVSRTTDGGATWQVVFVDELTRAGR